MLFSPQNLPCGADRRAAHRDIRAGAAALVVDVQRAIANRKMDIVIHLIIHCGNDLAGVVDLTSKPHITVKNN